MIKSICRRTCLLITLLVSVPALGRGLTGLDLSVHDSDITPAVTLREHENRMVEEYRVNNQLYMVKITPTIGAPYYLVDEDGSGDMAWLRGASETATKVPQWALMSW